MPISMGEQYTPQPVAYSTTRIRRVESKNTEEQNTSRLPSASPEPSDPPKNESTNPTKAKVTRSTNLKNVTTVGSKTKWPTWKKVVIGLIIALVCILIVVAIVVAVLLTRSSGTTSITYVLWSFDSVTTDTYGVYNGQLVNSATYSPTSTTLPYLGQGHALYVMASQNQSFQVSSPFLSLASTSFTIEAWIYSSTVTGDNGIMGQCQCSSCSNQCFFFLIRSSKLYVGFTFNDINGLTTLSTNTWYHVAFVYNAATKQQIIYLNGVQDNIKSNAAAYAGSDGIFTVGTAIYYPSTAFFTGYIDNVKITTEAKSATEILTAASLIAYYSFDLPNTAYDKGPNGLNGTVYNAATVSGRVNQGLQLTGSLSYFQAYGFYQAGFGVSYNKPFSVSLWIKLTTYTSGTFVSMSTTSTGSWCFNMLGIWSYTGNSAQIIAQGYAWPTIYGPPISLNSWTHISWTFSLANGYRLYVNGAYFGTTGYYSYGGTSGVINWLQIGYAFSCSSAYVSNNGFQGTVDEVYIHNREISASEVSALASV